MSRTAGKIVIWILALGSLLILAAQLYVAHGQLLSIPDSYAGFGTPRSPYSDSLGPWLYGTVSYFFSGVPNDTLYRPTLGLFYSSILSLTGSVAAIPVTLSCLGGGLLVGTMALAPRRLWLVIAALVACLPAAYEILIRPLNPEAISIDFCAMMITLASAALIGLALSHRPVSVPVLLGGFILLGLTACIRGPQLGAGVLLAGWLVLTIPGPQRWILTPAALLLFILPTVIDHAIQRRYDIESNAYEMLYSVYRSPDHMWSPAMSDRYHHVEHPVPGEVSRQYLRFMLSTEGVKLVCVSTAQMFSYAAYLLRLWPFRFILLIAFLAQAPSWGIFAGTGRSSGRLLLAGLALLLFMSIGPAFAVTVSVAAFIAVALGDAWMRRRPLTAALALVYLGSVLVHASWGLTSGIRIGATYTACFAGLCVAFCGEPAGVPTAPEDPPSVRWQLALPLLLVLLLVGYCGNFVLARDFKAHVNAELGIAGLHGAVKLSNDPLLNRSLYVTGDHWQPFYTLYDPLPFGTVRRWIHFDPVGGLGNSSFFRPCKVVWASENFSP